MLLRLSDIKPETMFRMEAEFSTLCLLDPSLFKNVIAVPKGLYLYFDVIDFKLLATDKNPAIEIVGQFDPSEMFI